MNGRRKAKTVKLQLVHCILSFLTRCLVILCAPRNSKISKTQVLSRRSPMRRRVLISLAVMVVLALSTLVLAQGGFKRINEIAAGVSSYPVRISTTGSGEFHARISNDESRIDWELSYSDL